MSKSVEFEVLLKTGKFREAAQESEQAIKDVGSAVSGSTSSMADEFSSVGEQIEFQKDVIRTLKEEIKQLEASLKNATPGTEWANVTTELQNVKRELAGEERGLEELQGQLEETEQKHVSLRTQLREVREELVAMEMAGKRGTEAYRDLQERAGALQDAMSDATAQMQVMAHDQRGFQGIISGLSGVSGAFSAAAGAASLFGSENENLQKVMLKVQSLMAITVGLQQVQQTLDKDSAFRLVTLNGLKEWWAKVVREASAAEAVETATMTAGTAAATANAAATTAAGTAATGAAGAFKILGTAIKSIPVIGWILTALAAVGSLIGLIASEKKKEKENNAVLNERKDILKDLNNIRREAVRSVAEEESRLRTQISLIKSSKEGTESYNRAVRSVAQSLGVNEGWLKKNISKVGELAEAWISVKRSEALSDAYAKEYADERIEGEKKLLAFRQARVSNNMEGNKQNLVQAGFSDKEAEVIANNVHKRFEKNNQKIREGVEWLDDYERKLLQDNKTALDNITRQQEAAINSQIALTKKYEDLTKGNGEKNPVVKNHPEDSDQKPLGWQAELAKLTAERNKAVAEMRSLIGKSVHYEFGDVTYDAESIQADLEKIESDFQKAVYELAKNHGLDIKVPVEVSPEADDSAYRELLDQYADYKRQEASINKKYDEQVANANGDAALIDKINEARKNALTDLSMEALKTSTAFGTLYGNTDRLGRNLKKLLTDRVKELVSFISAHKGDLSFATGENASKFGISTEALANLLQSDDALKALVKDLDAIENSDAISGLTKAIQKLKKAKANASIGDLVSEEDIAKAEDAVMSAVERVKGAVVGELSNIGEALRDMGEYLDNYSLKEAGDILSDILGNFQAAESGAQAWGGWWGAIIGGVTDLIPKIVKYATASNDLDEGLNNLSLTMQHLESDLSLLDTRMRNGISTEQILEKWKLVYYEMENAREQYWLALSNHKDEEARQYLDDYWAFVEELKGVWGEYYEYLSGTSVSGVFDDMSDMIWDAFDSGKDAIDDFEQYFNDMLVNMIRKQVLWNTIGDRMRQYIEDLTYHISEGNLTGDDAQDYISWLRSYGEDIMQDGQAALEAVAPIIEGLTSAVEDAGTLSGSIQGITSEQAGMLAGQMNAMRTAQAAQTALLTDQLEALNDIEHNTRYVREIYNFLRRNNGANSNLNRAYGQN